MLPRRGLHCRSNRAAPPVVPALGVSWEPIETAPPGGELLIYCDGRCVVATVVEGAGPDGGWRDFMDPRTDEVFAAPTHWMALPLPPIAG